MQLADSMPPRASWPILPMRRTPQSIEAGPLHLAASARQFAATSERIEQAFKCCRDRRPAKLADGDFFADAEPDKSTRIVELIERHWPHEMGHSGRQTLCTVADAAVVNERRRAGQQFAERNEAEMPHTRRQLRGKLIGVLGEQNAAPARPLTCLDGSGKELLRRAVGRARRKGDRRRACRRETPRLRSRAWRPPRCPKAESRRDAYSSANRAASGQTNLGNSPSTKSVS